MQTCPECHGEREVLMLWLDDKEWTWNICPTCDGHGEVENEDEA